MSFQKVESMNYKTAEALYNFFRMSKVEKQGYRTKSVCD